MPKPIVNNKINYQNIYGLIAKHESFLSQGVQEESSPTFENLVINGDGTIRGNLFVEGNTTILNTNVIEFEDNIILLNRLETGAGVTLNQSGLEIQRGSLENYRMIFNETDRTFRIGFISNLQAVATREDTPLQNGIMTWNQNTKRLDSTNAISIDLRLNSTTNSTSTSTGSLVLSGGIAIQKDIWSNGKLYLHGGGNSSIIGTDNVSGSLKLTSVVDIDLDCNGQVNIPYNKPLVFGNSTQSIMADVVTKNIDITSAGHVHFNLNAGKNISIPNQIPLIFATQNERIYTDSSNNMVIGGGQDIYLVPGSSKKVLLPVDIGLSFSNNNQQISANLNNDLSILAGNNILLTPGPTLDVRIPTDNGIKFGNSGAQRITSDSRDDLKILSSADIYLTATDNINVPDQVFLTFGKSSQYIRAITDDLYIETVGKINVLNTDINISSTSESINAGSGSIYTSGGLGVSKTIYTEKAVIVDSNESSSFIVRKSGAVQDVFLVRSNNNGKVEIVAGDGTVSNPSMEIISTSVTNSKSLIKLQTQYDNTSGYMIGRGYNTLNAGRSFTINIPTYNDYSSIGNKPRFSITTADCTEELFSIETDTGDIICKGAFQLTNTKGAVNATTGSFVVSGGLGVVENIITNGDYKSFTYSETTLDLKNSVTDVSVFKVDTKFGVVTTNADLVVNNTASNNTFRVNNSFIVDSITNTINNSLVNLYTDTTDSTDINTAAVVVSGGVSIAKKLRVNDTAYFNTVDMGNTRIKNVKDPVSLQDVATKAYVDLASLKGLYIKQSVQIASVAPGNLSSNFSTGVTIDGYTLNTDDRILIKDQLNPIENGIYIVRDSGAPSRSLDMFTGDNAAGVFTFIKFGNLQASTGWVCNSSQDNDVVDTDNLTFVQFSGLGQITAGAGLIKNFNDIYVNVDDSSIEIAYDTLRIKDTFAGVGLAGGSGVALQTTSDQSHVTKLGTIDTGVWEGTPIELFYGGTGRNYFTEGSILIGDGINPIKTNRNLFFDSSNYSLGLGTNQPSHSIHVAAKANASLLLDADIDNISSTSKPQIVFSYNGDNKSYIGLPRVNNEYASNIYADSLVISHDKVDDTSIIQFATQRQNRMTILSNGNIGINSTNPSTRLQINGTFSTNDINSFRSTVDSTNTSNGAIVISGGIGIRKSVNIGGKMRIYDNTPSSSSNTGAFVVQGGLSVQGNQNAVNVGNGGGLTVAGGASVGGDLYVGGSINGSGSSSSTYAYLTLTATDEAINFSSGSLVSLGGITLQCRTNSSSLTDGGSILTEGGASIGSDVYIGGTSNLYGATNHWGGDNIINFFDIDLNKRFSLDRDSITSEFSLSRYNTSGIFVEKTFNVDNVTGSIVFTNTLPSYDTVSASVILNGGMSINTTFSATSITSGGALTVMGGGSILENLFVGGDVSISSTLVVSDNITAQEDMYLYGDLTVDKSVTINDKLEYNTDNLFDVIINESGLTDWNYFGKINDLTPNATCEIDFYNAAVSPKIYSLKLIITIKNGICKASHNYYGDRNSTKLDVVIYKNASEFHLFAKVPALSNVSVHVKSKTGGKFTIVKEGNVSEPNGIVSGYQNTWLQIYTTSGQSNLPYNFGDVTVEGSTFMVADNFPVIGYNNANTNSSRHLGLAFQRYQESNDLGTGELVTDQYVVYDSIPDQSSTNSMQIKFTNLLNETDNYYNGWWIRIGSGSNINQVRKIISYNGAQRVATLDTAWTNQNPSTGDIAYFYNGQYLSMYFDDSKKGFEFVYNTRDATTRAVTSYDYVNLNAKGLSLSDTTVSNNASSGSIRTSGGISINNTNDSSSCTEGGTITTLGGASIRKTLYVGNTVAIGENSFIPNGSIHIKQDTSSIRLENAAGLNSYIDFAETGNVGHFGILSDSLNKQFSLTVSNSSGSPENSQKILTAVQSGYIGINTTSNINSPLAIKTNNFISCDGNSGYLGLIGGSSNTDGSSVAARIILCGNDNVSKGNVAITPGTSGSFQIFTNGDQKRMNIDKSGIVSVLATNSTDSATSGALVVSGGLAISTSKNATNTSNGGGLTVAGGTSISKDVYIGGDLYIEGALNASGSSTNPVLTFTNMVNCTIASYHNSKLLIVAKEAILSFVVWIIPSVVSQNNQVEFALPKRTSILESRSEYIASCTGYTDDEEVTSLFNCISVGVKNESRGLVKFQSVSTGIHYLNIICRYTID